VIWLKRAVAVGLLGVALYLFWPVVQELRRPEALSAFSHAAWGWLAAAALIQAASYACLTALNCLLLRPFEGKVSFGRMLLILPAMAFIEVAIPSAGASGVVLRVRFLGRQGYSAEAATFTLVLESLYLTLALAVASFSGLGFLIRTGHLSRARLWMMSGAGLALLVLGVALYFVARNRERASGWAMRLGSLWNRLAPRIHLRTYALEHISARMDGFYGSLARLNETPRWPFFLAALGRIALDVATLGACFLAFRCAISPGVVLTGYGMTLLLSGLAALPGGLGLADISLAGLYAQLGVQSAALNAAAAALAYRLIAFWLLRLVGFFSWQVLETRA
jgi:putative heme transporter